MEADFAGFCAGMYYWFRGSYYPHGEEEGRAYACHGSLSVSRDFVGCFVGKQVDQLVPVINF